MMNQLINCLQMESVLRTRLRWPGNFIHFNAGRHNYTGSAKSGNEEDDMGSDNDSEESDSGASSYMEMPATTMVLPSPSPDSSDPESGASGEVKVDILPVVEYPPGFNKDHRRRVSMFPESASRSSKQERRRSKGSDRRRDRSALVFDVTNNDSDSSYIELPATTVSPEDEEDFYKGSLACEGGQRVMIREDEEMGGVEIIPQDHHAETVEVKVNDGREDSSRQKNVHFVEDEVKWEHEYSSLGVSNSPVLSSSHGLKDSGHVTINDSNIPAGIHGYDKHRRIANSKSCPQSIQGQPGWSGHCNRQPVCLSSENLAPGSVSSAQDSSQHSKTKTNRSMRVCASQEDGRRARRTQSNIPCIEYDSVLCPQREQVEVCGQGARTSPLRESTRAVAGGHQPPRRQHRAVLVETDIDSVLGNG